MLNILKLKNFRWYDLPNFVLNKVAVGDHATCVKNIIYGDQLRQVFDIYIPHNARQDGAIILFCHGGSWQYGQKDDYVFLAQSLAKEGYYTVCMNYRFAPEFKFPDYVEDTIQVTNWINDQANAEKFGFNANKIILLGHSAGAYNVLSALYHPDLSVKINYIDAIHSVIGMAGPYSFEHRGDPVAKDAFPQTIPPQEIMPNYFVFKNNIPHLLLLADHDKLVADDNTFKMQQALIKVENQVRIETIRYTTHVSIVATLAQGFDRLFNTKNLIKRFIDQSD